VTDTRAASARSLLADGKVVIIRELAHADVDQVRRLHRDMPPEDRYLRFLTVSGAGPDRYAEAITASREDRGAVGAFADGTMLGIAAYLPAGAPGTAEVALAVTHEERGHGVGTLLLEYLGSLARRRGVRRFTADVLAANVRMLRVLTDVGLPVHTERDHELVHVELDLNPDDAYLDAVAKRERTADEASLRAVLRPRSVVVVGAGRHPGSVGHAVLRNLRSGGFTGRVVAVNPHAREVLGVPCYRSVDDVPGAVDLAVVCVPAQAVPEVATACGRRGVSALLVISSGLSADAALAGRLLDATRAYGMRLVGPNCLGVVNSDPEIRLDANFTRGAITPGEVGVVTQSGGVAIALLEDLGRLGLGVSTLVSTGDKYDVSGNDLLRWWDTEERTRIAVLYLESFGNPRKFSRLARHLARGKPVLAVRAASTEMGQRAAASHTASTATPVVLRDALFRQAGVLAVADLSAVTRTIALLARQPLPAGRGIAMVSNVGGAGVLAADAVVHYGLSVAELSSAARTALAEALPAHASAGNPVDTTAAVSAETFHQCLRVVLADPGVHAVLGITAPTAIGDPAPGIAAAAAYAAELGKTLAAVRLGQPSPVQWLTAADPAGGTVTVPSYADPADAVAAVAMAAERAAWLSRPAGRVPTLSGFDEDTARTVVRRHLRGEPEGGWLDPDQVAALLHACAVPVLGGVFADSADAAVAAQRSYDAPIALKAIASGLLHKSHGGGIRLGLSTAGDVRAAYDGFAETFGGRLRGVLAQPMVAPGRELLVGISADPQFGPLVVLGLGGTDTDMLADRAARLVPLSDVDAEEMLDALRSSPMLFGPDAPHRVDRNLVRDVLLRVARLAELIPEIAELDINPLMMSRTGGVVVDARVRVAPVEPVDPFLRSLRC
jgi:acyl-CoA synthetase (NDP forming)/GNAT superfamily N-acetyltransferase